MRFWEERVNLSSYVATTGSDRMTRRVLRGFSRDNFVSARKRANLTVFDLTRLSEVSSSTIYHWERGIRIPQVDVLAKVMNVLGAPISDVVPIDPHERFPGDWRVMKGITIPQLAAAAGLSTFIVQRIERADYALSPDHAARLASQLGITAREYQQAYERARDRDPGTPA